MIIWSNSTMLSCRCLTCRSLLLIPCTTCQFKCHPICSILVSKFFWTSVLVRRFALIRRNLLWVWWPRLTANYIRNLSSCMIKNPNYKTRSKRLLLTKMTQISSEKQREWRTMASRLTQTFLVSRIKCKKTKRNKWLWNSHCSRWNISTRLSSISFLHDIKVNDLLI